MADGDPQLCCAHQPIMVPTLCGFHDSLADRLTNPAAVVLR